jgi:hypothetical protein
MELGKLAEEEGLLLVVSAKEGVVLVVVVERGRDGRWGSGG